MPSPIIGSNGFHTVPLNTVMFDHRPMGLPGGFDVAGSQYLAPAMGIYEVGTRLRMLDNVIGPSNSYAQGAG
ncbi:MAG: hypothetical protein ACRYG7_08815 [Janthinobacterium lividum]